MNWVRFRRDWYIPLMAVVAIAAVLAAVSILCTTSPLLLLPIVLLLLVPGTIGRWLLKDLLASRSFIAMKNYPAGLAAAQRFLDTLRKRPWIRHAIWTQAGVYTLNVEAMALNNCGAAMLELRQLEDAQSALEGAKNADPHYPIPVFNLAVLAKLKGEVSASEALVAHAAKLGFANGNVDRLNMMVGDTYARLASGQSLSQ